MKSIITAFLFAFVAMSAFTASAADNPGWYVVYKMASTTTTLRGNETSKAREFGYLVIGISEYADSICAESGNILEFVRGEGNVYTTYTTGLNFKIQTQDIAPRWVGSSVIVGTSGPTVIYNRIEGISGSKFKLVNICHCVEEPNSTKYQLVPETVPQVLTGHSVNVIPNAVESTTSTYKLDVYASIIMNHSYICVDGHSFQLAPPASLDEAVEAFKAYIKTQTGGTFAE